MPAVSDMDLRCFLLKGNPLNFGQKNSKTGKVVNLKHPKNNTTSKFFLVDDMIHEIVQFDQKKSIFINDYVKSDGKLYFSAPIDPIFIVLPYLKSKTEQESLKIEEILQDDLYPNLADLSNCMGLKHLHVACDEENGKFKYNEERLLSWLDKKYEQVHKILSLKKVSIDTIDKSIKGVLCQYLSNGVLKLFLAHRDAIDSKDLGKRKSMTALMSDKNKKQKL